MEVVCRVQTHFTDGIKVLDPLGISAFTTCRNKLWPLGVHNEVLPLRLSFMHMHARYPDETSCSRKRK